MCDVISSLYVGIYLWQASLLWLYNNRFSQASRQSTVVSFLGSRPGDPGLNPGWWLANWECDGNALKRLLREPPCGTCQKDLADIKWQDHWSGSLDQLIFNLKDFPILLYLLSSTVIVIYGLKKPFEFFNSYLKSNL